MLLLGTQSTSQKHSKRLEKRRDLLYTGYRCQSFDDAEAFAIFLVAFDFLHATDIVIIVFL